MIKIGDHHLSHTRDVAGPFANKIESSKFDYISKLMTTNCTFEGGAVTLDLNFNFKLDYLSF